MMKKISFSLLLFSFFFQIQTIQTQDVAIIGLDGSLNNGVPFERFGDEFTFVLLRNFAAGEVIYFTEDEYVESNDAFEFGEGHISFTVPAGGLNENEVIGIEETSNGVFTVLCGTEGTVTPIGSGDWSLSHLDEIYAYSASNPSSPWNSITEVHFLLWTSPTTLLVGQDPTPNYPNVVVVDNWIGGSGGNYQLLDAAKTNTTQAMLHDISNWSSAVGSAGITLSCTDLTNQMIRLPSSPVVSISAVTSTIIENGSTNLVYRFSRTGDTSGTLPVDFGIGGTASSSDFSVTTGGSVSYNSGTGTGMITFPANEMTVDLIVSSVGDLTVEADETVIVTILP